MNLKGNLRLIPMLMLLHFVNLGICRPQSFFGFSPFSRNQNDNSVKGHSLREKIQKPISTVFKAIGSPFSRKNQAPVQTEQDRQIVFPYEKDDIYRPVPQVQSRLNTDKPSKYVEDVGAPNRVQFITQPPTEEKISDELYSEELDNEEIKDNSITTTENDISTTEDYETTTDSGLDFRGGGVNSNVVASLLGR